MGRGGATEDLALFERLFAVVGCYYRKRHFSISIIITVLFYEYGYAVYMPCPQSLEKCSRFPETGVAAGYKPACESVR